MKKILTLMMLLGCGGGAFAQCSLGPITGSTVLCPPSYTTTLSNSTSGGTWSTGDGGCITIDPSTGVVTGTCGGTETVTYTVGSCSVYYNIGSTAIIGPGSGAVCSAGPAVTMTNAFGGGTWGTTSSDITINSGGIVSVLSGLTATTSALITYVPPISTGCTTATTNIVVDLSPKVTGLTSSPSVSHICELSPISFTTTITGGTSPYTYNWWWLGGSSGSFASNVGVTGLSSTGYQMGGITLAQDGTYYTTVVDWYGCISPASGYTPLPITVISYPSAYTLSASCYSPGCPLSLSGSDVGTNYELWLDGITLLSTTPGTGGSLPWTTSSTSGYYYYAVVARDGTGTCGTAMLPGILMCPSCRTTNPYVGVGATPAVEPLVLLPNPNSGNFTLSGSADFMTGAESIKAEIIDITGHRVLAQDVPVTNGSINQAIQLPGDIANGLYFVKLGNGTQSQVLRLSVNR